MQIVYVLVGVPGCGKTWLLDQLPTDRFTIIRNDDYIGHWADYMDAIFAAADGDRPVVCEATFSVSAITGKLSLRSITYQEIYIIESREMLRYRWSMRGTDMAIQMGHLTRQRTYLGRAEMQGAPHGTSDEMLETFRGLV